MMKNDAPPTPPPNRATTTDDNGSRSSSSYASRFALWGAFGSVVSIAFLSSATSYSSYSSTSTSTSRRPVGGGDDDRSRRETRRRRRRRRRRSLFLLPSTGDVEGEEGGAMTTTTDEGEEGEVAAVEGGMPCGDIFVNVARHTGESGAWDDEFDSYDARLCEYARSCDGEDASMILLPLVTCRGKVDDRDEYPYDVARRTLVIALLPPALFAYLILLFRLLATTADSYFSPALESFSFELGLPPRFAGATLLALGNGSPDLGSTVNSILLWNEATALHNEKLANQALEGGYNEELHRKEGWMMSLGSLAGGGMFVGTIVCGLLVRSCDGIACRFSFLRDVAMYALSVCVVWRTLESGDVGRDDVVLFFGMYLAYISVILISDLYHRRVTLRRLKEEKRLRRRSFIEKARRMSRRVSRSSAAFSKESSEMVEITEENGVAAAEAVADETTPLMQNGHRYGEGALQISDSLRDDADIADTEISIVPSIDSSSMGAYNPSRSPTKGKMSVTDRFAMLLSNYDPSSVRFDTMSHGSSSGSDDDDDENKAASEWKAMTTMLHQVHPGIHHPEVHRPMTRVATVPEGHEEEEEEKADDAENPRSSWFESSSGEPDEESVIADGVDSREWSADLFVDAYDELKHNYRAFMTESFQDEYPLIERMMAFLELPFIALRTLSIPIPSEENYCRPAVALSISFAPYWFIYSSDLATIPAVVYCVISLIVGLCILRYADDEKLPLLVSIPISLYGFFIAATWINSIAEALVGLLQFAGTISRIPSTILGLTVLSWGNSMGDLSANLAMARKGMPDMATTGCFAGPSFNLLVGMGLGFLNLQYKLGRSSISPVSLTPSIRIGFAFIIVNCLSIVVAGYLFGWRLPRQYSFFLFALYILFSALCIERAVVQMMTN